MNTMKKNAASESAAALSAKAKLNFVITSITVIIAGLFLLGLSGMEVLSGLRAFVGAEALWSKGQKEATIHLLQYASGQQIRDYEDFKKELARPLGDKQARLELEKEDPELGRAYQGLILGGSHPDDVRSMAFLFRWFRDFEHIDKAISIWERGDALIDELWVHGKTLQQRITAGGYTDNDRDAAIERIHLLDKSLTSLEEEFSAALGEASRWAKGLLRLMMVGFVISAGAISLVLLLFIRKIIEKTHFLSQELVLQHEDLARQNQLVSTQNAFNERIRGEQTESEFCRNVISFLANHLDALIGIFYVVDEDTVLRSKGTYAYYQSKNIPSEFHLGNGLVGQAARDKQSILISNVPGDQIKVQSALGEIPPRHLLFFPIILDGRVKGVLELGSFHPFSDSKMSFLEQVVENIAVSLEMIQSRARMAELLQQIPAQARLRPESA